MKLFQPKSLFFLAFLSLLFVGCDNEPLEGEFVTGEEGDVTAEEGQFVATIDGETFIAESTQVVFFTETNTLSITGTKSSTGEVITLAIGNPSVAEFDLTQGTGTINGAAYLTGEALPNPYVSAGAIGGTGSLNLTVYDTDALTVSGAFSFTGARIQLDDDGNPVLDAEGNPVIQTININAGSFNTLPYIIDDTMGGSGGSGGSGGVDPDDLFAQVDGIDFTPVSVAVTQYVAGMQPMIQILATDAAGATIRVDVPETLETGTFDFFNGISDGSQLIAYYNANNGGETLSSNPGTITITEFSSITGRLVADFNFTGRDPLNVDPTIVEVTEGSLDVAFVPTTGAITFSFEATVDGTVFEPETAVAVQSTVGDVNVIRITATLGNRVMEISFPASVGPGSYGMSPLLITGNEVVGIYTPDSVSGESYTSDPGTLEITSIDATTGGLIEGTFNFTAKDATGVDPTVFEITNGSFLLELQ